MSSSTALYIANEDYSLFLMLGFSGGIEPEPESLDDEFSVKTVG